MLHDILFALWFLLPAAAANMAPVLTAAVPLLKQWDAPLDGGRTFRGVEIFGSHKTWRGLISGIILATITLYLQQALVTHTNWASFVADGLNYEALPTLILGPLFALGALGGDAIESFFKRQRGIQSGGSWVPFDQIDYIIGAIVASLPIFVATPSQYFWMLLVWFIMHLAFSYVGWLLKLKKQPI
jgi:CDP-2,3-bis-(O-geranylgeranyl)-sn-glycerol synthase